MSQDDRGARPFGTRFPGLFAALAAPFEADEVKVRTQAGRQLHYITARTAMNRLDEVLGPESWWDAYVPGEHSVMCTLTVRLPDGQILSKSDAGGMAGMADPGDDDKSGFADAFKRAAVKFGVGRYLYRDGIPRFAREVLQGRREEAPPSDPPAGEKGPSPKDCLKAGMFEDWLKAFVRAANAHFRERHPHVPGVLIERGALLGYLADACGCREAPDHAAALTSVFDVEPLRMHEEATSFFKQRSTVAAGIKKGLKAANGAA